MRNAVHHIELWTSDLGAVEESFGWLMPELGWLPRHGPDWPQGRVRTRETGGPPGSAGGVPPAPGHRQPTDAGRLAEALHAMGDGETSEPCDRLDT